MEISDLHPPIAYLLDRRMQIVACRAKSLQN